MGIGYKLSRYNNHSKISFVFLIFNLDFDHHELMRRWRYFALDLALSGTGEITQFIRPNVSGILVAFGQVVGQEKRKNPAWISWSGGARGYSGFFWMKRVDC